MTLAFNSKHPYVPNPSKDKTKTRWIASLSDGSTVFEDITPYINSAWSRLRQHIVLHKLTITNLRLEGYGTNVELVPYKDDNGKPQIDGYWYSKKILDGLNIGPFKEFNWSGIGAIRNGVIFVTWIGEDGKISHEFKEFHKDNLACILNREI